MNTKTMPRGGTPARARRPEPKHAAPKAHRLDTGALLGIVLLLAVGLIALFSASYPAAISKFNDGIYFIKRQGLYAMIGFVAMLVISGIDYHIYLRFQKPLFVVCIGLLILVIIPGVGVNHNGATRWIDLPLLGEFQPSELMKDAIIISFSYYAVKFGDRVRKIRGDLPFFGALLLVAGLLYFEPHLSGTIIIFGIGLAILIVAGMKIWYFIPIGIVVAAAGVWYIATQGYANARIEAWLNPFATDELFRGDGWQGGNSQIAIGSGGFWGLGPRTGQTEAPLLARAAERLHLLGLVRGDGLCRGAPGAIVLFAFLIYRCYYHRVPRAGQDGLPAGDRHRHQARHPDAGQPVGRDRPVPGHRRVACRFSATAAPRCSCRWARWALS